ncbi:MAG: hypothetical protein U9P00_04620 [Pseudomonadota bacterium]|nr:hypothetical protein [Pseudomonadota bacterium]
MHLLVAITPHGFGHAAQVSPVINALRQRLPALRLTILTSLPEAFLRGRIQGDFKLIAQAPDFGLLMNSALDIDLEASAAAYAELHRNWQQRVDAEARRLESIVPDLVLADVPYLTLAAARQAAIPAAALCSLNWADIYRHYFANRKDAGRVLAQMESAYLSAGVFLCPEPSMPMSFLDKRVPIGPVAAQGRQRRDDLIRQLGLDPGQSVVLVAPGGVETRFALENWPGGQGIHWLVSERWQVRHPNVSPLEKTGLGFTDLVASCDAVLGKCGYGTVSECVVNATPLLYIPRPDWPEEQVLLQWLETRNAAVPVDPIRLGSGVFTDLVVRARSLVVKACRATGASQAADYLLKLVSAHAGDGGIPQ